MQTIYRFEPVYKPRPWGGRAIGGVGCRCLPSDGKIGESWEITDRPGDESVIREGEWRGKSIRWLLDEHGSLVMGRAWGKGERFPLLVKVLDAAERLSLQVHPPARAAAELGGEPKTEAWYLLGASANAGLMAGLRKGVTRERFERELKDMSGAGLEALVQRLPVKTGDAIFIPSGRIHAVDAGCLILEVQQNSDTTYRVWDWGRLGLDGKPRALQVKESLASIDFEDFEPQLTGGREVSSASGQSISLVDCEYFTLERWRLASGRVYDPRAPMVVHGLKGNLAVKSDASGETVVPPGETFLLAAVPHRLAPAEAGGVEFLAGCPR
ncbi:MAG: class I mannose-6-phosphate isomerase [Verrucomicrobiae bacterium]|nr:class I mannose-6-phosphate isomerase [Verrucomicrobiae bacterium]